jgi:hypothetical protein
VGAAGALRRRAARGVQVVAIAAGRSAFEGGHFRLDEYSDEIAEAIIDTFPASRVTDTNVQ